MAIACSCSLAAQPTPLCWQHLQPLAVQAYWLRCFFERVLRVDLLGRASLRDLLLQTARTQARRQLAS